MWGRVRRVRGGAFGVGGFRGQSKNSLYADRLAPWLIGFSVVLAFLAFVVARILTWVKKAARAPAALASAAHETLPKAFLHDLSATTNWKRHRFEKPLTWLGRIVMEPKGDDADHLVVDKGTVGRRHARHFRSKC